jgi:hypothetical protein
MYTMKNITIYTALLFAFVACTSQVESVLADESTVYGDVVLVDDTLFCKDNAEFEYAASSCAFVDQTGKEMIRAGKYKSCFSGFFATFLYVSDAALMDGKVVAINRNEEVIFEAYMYDNAPDDESEGLFRIIRDGKIGFANQRGEIVIPATYACAEQFSGGKAKVTMECVSKKDGDYTTCESKNWFYIDLKGEKL